MSHEPNLLKLQHPIHVVAGLYGCVHVLMQDKCELSASELTVWVIMRGVSVGVSKCKCESEIVSKCEC